MAPKLGFPVFDGDNHLYETRDALTKFLPPEYGDAIRYVEVDGRTKIATMGQISDYIPNPTFDVVAAPGAQEDYFRHGNPEGKTHREILGKPIRSTDAFREPGPRLALLDEQGVDKSMMYPTLASLVEERFRDYPEATHTIIHALNQWLHETWSFDYRGRIFTTPIITLPIVEKAIEELDWAVEHGARAVLIRPAPVPGSRGSRSFALPEFDPFWKRVTEADVLVVMHASDSGYSKYANDWEGAGEFRPFQPTPFRSYYSLARNPAEDAVAALACHGLLTRFPELRIAMVENGTTWLPRLLQNLADTHKKMPQLYAEDPLEAIQRCVYFNPFWEENVAELAKLVGIDHLFFGSDYPHPEGLADPLSYAEHHTELTEHEMAMVMGGTLSSLMRVGV
jgi:predicted TIM-barrel fold metal-dependent hydrolase